MADQQDQAIDPISESWDRNIKLRNDLASRAGKSDNLEINPLDAPKQLMGSAVSSVGTGVKELSLGDVVRAGENVQKGSMLGEGINWLAGKAADTFLSPENANQAKLAVAAATGLAESENINGSDEASNKAVNTVADTADIAIKPVAQTVGGTVKDGGDWIKDAVSDQGKEALKKQFFTEDQNGIHAGDAWTTDPAVWAMKMSDVIGTVGGTLAVGGAVKGGVKAAVMRSMLKRGAPEVYAAQVAELTAQRIGEKAALSTGAAMSVGQTADQTRESVKSLSFEELMNSDSFKQNVQLVNQDPQYQSLSSSYRLDLARKRTADMAADYAKSDPTTYAAAAAGTVLGDAMLFKMITGKAGASAVTGNLLSRTGKGFVKGGLGEGAGEAVEEGAQQNIQNRSDNDIAGTSIDPMQGVKQSAAEAGFLGVMSGGGIGAGSSIAHGSNAPTQTSDSNEQASDISPDQQGGLGPNSPAPESNSQPSDDPLNTPAYQRQGDISPELQAATQQVNAEQQQFKQALAAEENGVLAPFEKTVSGNPDEPAFLRTQQNNPTGRDTSALQDANPYTEAQSALAAGGAPTVEDLIQLSIQQGNQGKTPQESGVTGDLLLASDSSGVLATTKQSGATIDGQSNEVIPESRGLGYKNQINMPGEAGNGINNNYVPPVTQSRQTADKSLDTESSRDPRSPVAQSIERAGSESAAIFNQLKTVRVTKRGNPFASQKEALLASKKTETPIELPTGGFGVVNKAELEQVQSNISKQETTQYSSQNAPAPDVNSIVNDITVGLPDETKTTIGEQTASQSSNDQANTPVSDVNDTNVADINQAADLVDVNESTSNQVVAQNQPDINVNGQPISQATDKQSVADIPAPTPDSAGAIIPDAPETTVGELNKNSNSPKITKPDFPWTGYKDKPDGTMILEGDSAQLKEWVKQNNITAIKSKTGVVVGKKSIQVVKNFISKQSASGKEEVNTVDKAQNDNENQTKEATSNPVAESVTPRVSIIEHKTGKGKVLQGVVRTDLNVNEAKSIDPYTFKKNGGYFIREQHMDKLPPDGVSQVIRAVQQPSELQLSSFDYPVSLNNVTLKPSKASNHADKLRSSANRIITVAKNEQSRERLTNTPKRAREAGQALRSAAKHESVGRTMLNIADEVERNSESKLKGIDSRATIDELERIIGRAVYEVDKKKPYSEQERNREPTEKDLSNAKMPMVTVYGEWLLDAAKTMESKANTGNSRLIASLRKLAGRSNSNGVPIASSQFELIDSANKKLKELKERSRLSDVVERISAVKRLNRAGINNNSDLHETLKEYIHLRDGVKKEDPVKAAERALVGQNVGIDFFPTPKLVAKKMAELAGVKPGMKVLEPSAGNGNLADVAKEAGAQVDVAEISPQLRNILELKGHNAVESDFNDLPVREDYDAILMNPPFSNRNDAKHIMKAYDHLKLGGKMVAIAGEGVFSGSDKVAANFREWLDERGADIEKLDGGTFNDRTLLATTGANARMIVITKVETEGALSKTGKTETTGNRVTPPNPSDQAYSDETTTGLDLDSNGSESSGEVTRKSAISHNGITIEITPISQSMINDYNRSVHLAGKRDFNEELQSHAKNLIDFLSKPNKHLMDSDEQKAEAERQVQWYMDDEVKRVQQQLQTGINNPSWFVTGRSGRDMNKANKKSDREMDMLNKHLRQQESDKLHIVGRLAKLKPEAVKTNEAFSAASRDIGRTISAISEYMRDGRSELEKDARKWASPKVGKLIDQSLQIDHDATITALKQADEDLQDVGGLVKVLGSRSGAWKLVSGLLGGKDNHVQFSKFAQNEAEKYGKGMTKPEASLAAKEWLRQFTTDINVEVVKDQAEFESSLADRGFANSIQNGEMDNAAYLPDSKTILINASAIQNPKRLKQIMRHEILVHHGLRYVVGEDAYVKIMNAIAQGYETSPAIRDAVDTVTKNYADKDMFTQMEEAFAHYAENRPADSGPVGRMWQRIIGMVKSALQKVNFVSVNESEQQLDSVLHAIARNMRQGIEDGVLAQKTENVMFSHGSKTDPFKPNKEDVDNYRAQLEKAMRSQRSGEIMIDIGSTSEVLKAVGAPDLVLRISRDTIRKAINGVKHDVPMNVIEKLPELLHDPISVFDSKTHPGDSLVVLLDATDKSGRSVVSAIQLKVVAGKYLDINRIASIHGRPEAQINQWLSDGLTRYIKENHPNSLRTGLQLPLGSSMGGHDFSVLTDADIRKRSNVMFSRSSPTDDELMNKLGLGPKQDVIDKTKERINKLKQSDRTQVKSWIDETIKKANTQILDALAPIKYAEDAGGKIEASDSGYVAARLASGSATVMNATMLHGLPAWKDGVIQRKDGTGEADSLLGIFENLGSDLHNWLGWMAGHRGEILLAEGRENLLTPEDISALKAKGNGKEIKFEAARAKWNALNKSVLDLAEEAGLFTAEDRAAWDNEWYVPFFRETEDGDVTGPYKHKGIANQTAGIKKLKGGTANVNDILQNIFTTTSKTIDAAMKNMAAQKVVYNLAETDLIEVITKPNLMDIKAAVKNQNDMMIVKLEGEDYLIRVNDKDLFNAMTMIDQKVERGAVRRLAMKAKHILTAGVTSSPDFMLRNFLRDAASTWAINEDGFKPIIDSIRGMKKAWKMDDSSIDMMFSGASFMGGNLRGNDPEAMASAVRKALRRKGMSPEQVDRYEKTIVRNGKQAMDAIGKYWEKYEQVGEAVENGSREAVYEAAIKAGKTHAQAAFEAKDLMDFSMMGSSKLMQVFVDVLPFFNARMQGLGKLGRAIKANPKQIAKRGGMIAGASLALLALNWDDERYEDLPDWDKDLNWHFWLSDQHFRIPKPFEIGLMFGTLPERIVRTMGGKDTTGKFGKVVARNMLETFAINPIPQVVKPLTEAYFNYDPFRGGPIESMSDMNVNPEARYDEQTSLMMRELGELTGMSPKKLEHIVSGYTGTMGGYVMAMGDSLVRMMGDYGDSPALRADQIPILKSVYQGSAPAKSTQAMQDFYQMVDEANQVYATIIQYRKEGRTGEANALLEESRNKLAGRKILNKAQLQFRVLRNEMSLIQRDKLLNSEQKRERIDRLLKRRNDFAAQLIQRFE